MSETYDLPGVPPQPPLGPLGLSAPGAETPPGADTSDAVPEQRPRPLGVTVAATGNADVDAAVERLRDADELPTEAHIEVYEDVHAGLRQSLAALDENRG